MGSLLYVIILNWNNAEDTIECIESVQRSTFADFQILVVDNGSTDDSVLSIQTRFPMIEILETGSNLGYAGGNNMGIRTAFERNAEYILILNNDTLIDRWMIEELYNFCLKRPAVGMVGPLMYCLEPPDMVFSAGSEIDWQSAKIIHHGMFEYQNQIVGISSPRQVSFIAGCGIFIRSAALKEAELLNEDYYLNYEDVELGIQVKQAGYEVWYLPSAILWHKISATLGLASPANTYYMTRNSLFFFFKHSRGIWKIINVSTILVNTIVTIAAWTIKPKYRTEAFKQRRLANILAVRDFISGKFGRISQDI
jgi:GT2 family glycosyltransferase